ncbi:MAG: SusD/RagB family nutrient-binding outer membrane lipoprotein [Prevotella sp.]
MKKLFLYSATAAFMMTLASCDLDINDNPNYPANGDVNPTLEFPAVENAIAVVPGDQMFTLGGFFVQYFDQRPEMNQYNTIAELHFDESSDLYNYCYRALYAGALADIKDIESKTDKPANLFACKAMKALALQYMVDACSDAPYTEACMGTANPSPKWEDGETVYKGVLKELDDAEAAVSSTDDMDMTDPLFSQDVQAWKKFANALRLRMYLRLIDGGIDAAAYTAKVKAIVAEGNLPDEDVAFDVYSNAEGQYNPWYGCAFGLTTNNFCAAHPLVSYYETTNDPRIGYAIQPAAATGKYAGMMPGSRTLYQDWGSPVMNKDVSTININVARSMPIYLFTAAEINFLKAEVELRFNNNVPAAKAYYEQAVEEDFVSRGITGASTFLAGKKVNFDTQATTADKLNLIYMQKWVAYFFRNHQEAWAEQRRTDVPKQTTVSTEQAFKDPTLYSAGDLFSPGLNYYGNGKTCKRMPYPSQARKLNKNTPPVKSLADPVFWDIK